MSYEPRGPDMSRAWLDDVGARLEQIKREELAAVPSYCKRFVKQEAQELIGRMCASPLVIQYDERDELVHTDEHPFCGDETCPCMDELYDKVEVNYGI